MASADGNRKVIAVVGTRITRLLVDDHRRGRDHDPTVAYHSEDVIAARGDDVPIQDLDRSGTGKNPHAAVSVYGTSSDGHRTMVGGVYPACNIA